MGFEQAKQYQTTMQASYYLNPYGWYHVDVHILPWEIAVPAPVFKKVLGIDYNVDCGCRDITVEQALELGFVFPTPKSGK